MKGVSTVPRTWGGVLSIKGSCSCYLKNGINNIYLRFSRGGGDTMDLSIWQGEGGSLKDHPGARPKMAVVTQFIRGRGLTLVLQMLTREMTTLSART